MKIYMLCDMEGVSGLYTKEHAWWWETDARPYIYADEGRRLLTEDINSAAAAALKAGVDALVVCDTHHGGGNILWNEMLADPRITYERPQSPHMMPSLDESFDGLILLGHHAKAGTQGAFLDHGYSTGWFDFQINGMSIGEVGMETCYAGHWDVPLIMVQGDDACCAEVESQFPGTVTAVVKRGLSFDRASGPAPELARALTAKKVAETIARVRTGDFKPFKPSLPITVRITATHTEEADRIARRPWTRRIDGRTVEATVDRQCDILAWATG
jgi:D-amino peptidase